MTPRAEPTLVGSQDAATRRSRDTTAGRAVIRPRLFDATYVE
jgi:hypothetical protein